jgi:hypothetical protein
LEKKELEERAVKKRLVTREEVEGEKPDWQGWFWEWNSKCVKERLKMGPGGKEIEHEECGKRTQK